MNSAPRTSFANGIHPLTQSVMTKKTDKPRPKPTDPGSLMICNDPLPAGRASPGHKYAAIFGALKPGQAIKCAPDEVGRIGSALRKWLDTKGKDGVIRTSKDYGDGRGRVWLLKPVKEV